MAAVYIAPIGHGLGDLIVCLPAMQWLIESGTPTYLVLRSPRQEGCQHLLPGLAGWVREIDLDRSKLAGGDRYINLREHPLQTDHVWGSAEFDARYPNYRIADIVRDICHDYGIMADFENLKPVRFTRLAGLDRTVALVPGSGGAFKCWPTQCWLELAQRLQNQGYSVCVLGQPDQSEAVRDLLAAGGAASGLDWIETPTFPDAVNVLSSVRAAVSVDTGLMHLALQQLLPTVGMWINNPGSLNYLRTVRHCFSIISPRCAPQCVSEELDRNLNLVTEWKQWCGYDAWTCHATPEARCMNNITVDAVWEKTRAALRARVTI